MEFWILDFVGRVCGPARSVGGGRSGVLQRIAASHATEAGDQLLSCVMESPQGLAPASGLYDSHVICNGLGDRKNFVASVFREFLERAKHNACFVSVESVEVLRHVAVPRPGDQVLMKAAQRLDLRRFIPLVGESRKENPPRVRYSWNFLCLYNREVPMTFPAEGVSVLPHRGRRRECDSWGFR